MNKKHKKPNLVETFTVAPEQLQPTSAPVPKKEDEKKRHIGGYFKESDYRIVKYLSLETGMTIQEILTQGINAVLRMYDKPLIGEKDNKE